MSTGGEGEAEDHSAGYEPSDAQPGSRGRPEDASRPEINTMLSSEAVENADVSDEPDNDEGDEKGEKGFN